MDSLPVALALGALVLAAAGFLFTRTARRRSDPGDFERRLEDLRRAHGISGHAGAVVGHTPRPGPEPPGDTDEDGATEAALPPPPTLEEYAASHGQARVYDDPDLGEFTFDPEGEEWGQAHDGAVPWLYIEAGEDGPADVQRRCLARFLDDEDAIVDRAFDGVAGALDATGREGAPMEAASVYVDAISPGQAFARGRVYFRFDGYKGLPATAATTDDWATITCEVDSSLEEED